MTLVVRVADRPGELARLFAVAADVGVNLEDVRIDHSMGRMTGLVELVVSDTAGERLAAALTASGFTVVG
jgi:prephenate dehydrogenase